MPSIVLSNGDADKSDKLLYNSGLRKYFDYIISAEEVGMQTCWISREDKKENGEIDIKPDYVFSSIENMGNNLSAMLCSLRHYDVNMNMM
jgi:FMN phosphatase YigB (HAD superfamily)